MNKVKIQPTEWEKIFTNEVNNKGLISKYTTAHAGQYQKPKTSKQQQKNHNPTKEMAEDLNRHFSKEDIWMAKKHMKRSSTSLIIREMQIKSTIRYFLTLIRMAIIKKSTNNKYWPGCGEKGPLLHCWWECREQYGSSLKTKCRTTI